MKTLVALAVGLICLVFTVAIVVAIEGAMNFSLFSLMLWFVVPAGALITGAVPAFAFYFAALKLHLKANAFIGVLMVALAAGVQFGIYFARWKFVAEASDYVGFGEFVQLMLANTQYQFGHSASTAVDLGVLGYGLALLQFAAVAGVGLVAYVALKGLPFCEECQRYPKELLKHAFGFAVSAADVSTAMRAHEAATVEYLVGVHALPRGAASGLVFKLLHCEGACDRYLVQELPATLRNGQWVTTGKNARVLWAARGVQLTDTFRSLQVRSASLGAVA